MNRCRGLQWGSSGMRGIMNLRSNKVQIGGIAMGGGVIRLFWGAPTLGKSIVHCFALYRCFRDVLDQKRIFFGHDLKSKWTNRK